MPSALRRGAPTARRKLLRHRLSVFGLLATSASCTQPGVRSEGRGEAEWQGAPPMRWAGRCVYEVTTRWATALPHIIRLSGEDLGWSVVISGPRRYSSGRIELAPAGAGGVQGIVFDGGTVRGSILGTLDVSRAGDSTFLEVAGTKVHRDTVEFRAGCRLGPPST